jgi:hypothetical protein
MNATKKFAAMLCAAMLWAAVAFAQRSNPCDPRYHFIIPSDCTSVAEQAGKHWTAAVITLLELGTSSESAS